MQRHTHTTAPRRRRGGATGGALAAGLGLGLCFVLAAEAAPVASSGPAAVPGAAPRPTQVSREPRSWAEGGAAVKTGGFIEKEDGRRLAHLRLTLTPRGRFASVHLAVSAQGDGVEPEQGWQGIRGANPVTAEEIDRLLEAGALSARLLAEDGEVFHARIQAGSPRHVPVRRLDAEGGLVHDARTERAYRDRFSAERTRLPSGRYRLQIQAREEVRLEVAFEFDSERAEIHEFLTLGGLHRLPEHVR